jgi:hypothetical protein
MLPELEPPNSPIRMAPVVIRFSSVLVRESRFAVSVPKSITLEFVRGAIVTIPPGVDVTKFADSSTSSERIFISAVEPVLVNTEEEVNAAVRKIMSPAIVFAADAGIDIV